MAEYIERERAIVDACNALELYPSEYAQLEDALNRTLAADVAPVRNGRWKIIGQVCIDGEYKDTLRCTNCGMKHDRKSRYCENCGARMDGDV